MHASLAFLHIPAASHSPGPDAGHRHAGRAGRHEPSPCDLPVTARAALCAGLTLRPRRTLRPRADPPPRPAPPRRGRGPAPPRPPPERPESVCGRLARARDLLSIPNPDPPGPLSPSPGATGLGARPSPVHSLGSAGGGSGGRARPSAPSGRLWVESVGPDRVRLRWRRRQTARGGPGEGRARRGRGGRRASHSSSGAG